MGGSVTGVDLRAEIDRLRKERNAVILAHYYQEPALQDIADFVGDSLDLSRKAQATDADVIAFCGVRFMAETAKILPPDKIVVLPDMAADALIADRAFDADARVLEPLAAAGKAAVIPPKGNRKQRRDYDRHLYKARHLIENFFAKLKQFRAIATRYDKLAIIYRAAVILNAVIAWTRQLSDTP